MPETDQKLDMTDDRGLAELGKAFDESFGPREGVTAPAAKEAKEAPPEKGAKAPQERAPVRERAAPGHHAPVEVKAAPAAPAEAGTGLLGEPLYEAKKRERKPITFDEEDIPLAKKESAFPGRDTKAAKPKAGPVVEPETEEETEPDEKEEADPDVDAVVVKPNAHPAVKEGFRRLRTIAKDRKAEIKALTQKAQALSAELEGIKKNGMPPEVQQELDRLRATSQRFDLLNDPSFKARYEDPIETAGDQILDFCINLAGGDETIKKWADETKKFGYKNLSTDYWDKEIIPKIASVTNQQRVASLAANLHAKIDERNRMVSDYTATPDKIAAYNQQKAHEYYSNYTSEAQDESNKLVAQVGEWAQLKDPSAAATDEERAEYEEHNNRVEGYKTLFEKTMGDVMHGGPRKHVRVVAQAVYGIHLDRLLKEKTADYDALAADYDALQAQYRKVTRARSIPGRTGGGVDVKPKDGLSTKDARSALKEYFSGGGN